MSHLRNWLEKRQDEHKEDIAREVKKHGQVRPPEAQVSSKTHKSYSKIRFSSPGYRMNFEKINWGA